MHRDAGDAHERRHLHRRGFQQPPSPMVVASMAASELLQPRAANPYARQAFVARLQVVPGGQSSSSSQQPSDGASAQCLSQLAPW
mmetsp:Transcript_58261/g.163269  ORF Transcript_58261/g.163269 Transcript_58261/m.163269 type:complete len:85 (-) Transcript_58261:204-458(-)